MAAAGTEPQRGPVPAVSTLVVFGKTAPRVAATASVLADWLDGPGAAVPLADVAHTLNHHRARQTRFGTVAAVDRRQAVIGLRALAAGQSAPGWWHPAKAPSEAARCSSTRDEDRSGPEWGANCWPTSRHSPLPSPNWSRNSLLKAGFRCAT